MPLREAPAQKSYNLDPGQYGLLQQEFHNNHDVTYYHEEGYQGTVIYKGALTITWFYDGLNTVTLTLSKKTGRYEFVPTSVIWAEITRDLAEVKRPVPPPATAASAEYEAQAPAIRRGEEFPDHEKYQQAPVEPEPEPTESLAQPVPEHLTPSQEHPNGTEPEQQPSNDPLAPETDHPLPA